MVREDKKAKRHCMSPWLHEQCPSPEGIFFSFPLLPCPFRLFRSRLLSWKSLNIRSARSLGSTDRKEKKSPRMPCGRNHLPLHLGGFSKVLVVIFFLGPEILTPLPLFTAPPPSFHRPSPCELCVSARPSSCPDPRATCPTCPDPGRPRCSESRSPV
jgi:hypothetical protein